MDVEQSLADRNQSTRLSHRRETGPSNFLKIGEPDRARTVYIPVWDGNAGGAAGQAAQGFFLESPSAMAAGRENPHPVRRAGQGVGVG